MLRVGRVLDRLPCAMSSGELRSSPRIASSSPWSGSTVAAVVVICSDSPCTLTAGVADGGVVLSSDVVLSSVTGLSLPASSAISGSAVACSML